VLFPFISFKSLSHFDYWASLGSIISCFEFLFIRGFRHNKKMVTIDNKGCYREVDS